MLVGRRMTREPKTVRPDDPLAHAAAVMREHRINHLPVVEGERLVGILSDTDLRNEALAREARGEGGTTLSGCVRDVMRTEVWSVTPDDALEDALLVMVQQRFGALPVLSGDRLVGIVTKVDLLNAFAEVLDVNDACLGVDVIFPKNLARFEEMIAALAEAGVEIRSAIVAPRGEIGSLAAHLRLAALDGPAVRRLLRERGFLVEEPGGAP